ncbi:MAG: hypothetical protein KJ597_04670 [Nanoarchaeota archaeon]|nr:hypothetical protein [Nanoarchaeota archaeon]
MQQEALVLEPAHTTAHTRAYSGDLGQLVSHSDGGGMYQPHDFVDTQKLRGFLVEEGAISGDEYPLDGGTNGTRFWQFHPNLAEHRRIIEERTGGERCFIYSPSNPMHLSGDESSLVTDAFVATPESNERSSRIWYEPTSPDGFTPESVLRVSARLQTTQNLFNNYAGGRYATEDGNKHINAALTDLKNKLYEEAGESTRLHVGLGYGIVLGSEGITLRADVRDDYAWAQAQMVPALKRILDNSDFGDAVVIRQELARIPLPSSSHTDDKMRKQVLDARRESGQRIIDDTITKYYDSAVEKALRELEKDEDVVRALKLM